MKRRDFCQWMGAGGTLSMLQCSPEFSDSEEIPNPSGFSGKIATTSQESSHAGILVVVENGRAVRIEGNPNHPLSRGCVSSRSQAAVQGLYSTHRITHPFDRKAKSIPWRGALDLLREKTHGHGADGLAVLTAPLSDASHAWWSAFLARMGGGRLVQYQSFPESAMLMACEKTFDQNVLPLIRLKGADCLVSLGARFLETWGNPLLQAREYAQIRTVRQGQRARHIQVSPRCSRTGANADRWIDCAPGAETLLALALLGAFIEKSPHLSDSERTLCRTLVAPISSEGIVARDIIPESTVAYLVKALTSASTPLVLPAETPQLGHFPMQHHIAVLLLNKALGAIGPFYNFHQSKPHTRIPSHDAAATLFNEIRLGHVKTLLIHAMDPAYVLPPDLGYSSLRRQVDFVALLTDSVNETMESADLVIPIRHDLERWGEHLSYAGMDTLQQPAVTAPEGVPQVEDLLFSLANSKEVTSPLQENFLPFLKRKWFSRFDVSVADESDFWVQVCQQGGQFSAEVPGNDLPISPNLTPDAFAEINQPRPGELTLSIHESERFGDGGFSDRSWLQESPHPITGIVWDSWVEVSPQTAQKNEIRTGDVVRIEKNDRIINLPAFVSPLLADNHLAVSTGHGHKCYADFYCHGSNASNILGGYLNDAGTFVSGPLVVQIQKSGEKRQFAVTSTFLEDGQGDSRSFFPKETMGFSQFHNDSVFQSVTLKNLAKSSPQDKPALDRQMDRHRSTGKSSWWFIIDLDKCTGCGACIVACYAKNKIPAVGKSNCLHGRDNAWLSILRFWSKKESQEGSSWQLDFMPMLCQHCQDAPCVQHCPTHAAFRSEHGTNGTDSERCVGFRACISACPYRVRRFGWYQTDHFREPFQVLNPQGAIATPGITQNCTLCLDRDQKKSSSQKAHRSACQNACPSGALQIIDGKLSSPQNMATTSRDREYRCLNQTFNTNPHILYLKKINSGL